MYITFEEFIAGWVGGVCGLITGHPLDTIKVRQQFYGTGMLQSIRRTAQYEGIKGFYRGMLFPLLTVGPSNAIFFGIYANTMHYLENSRKAGHRISPEDNKAITNVFVAGSVAGFVQVLFNCPVEVVKTVLQTKTESAANIWKKKHIVPYTGSWDTFKGIIKARGIQGLYRGCGPMIIRDVPTSGLYTLTYEMLMYSYFAPCQTPLILKQVLAGGFAGIASWLPVFPVDVLKSRIQADNLDKPLYKGMIHCAHVSYKNEGHKVFFKGLTSWLPVFPVDVLKSRIQADNPYKPLYKGMIHCAYVSYKDEGYKVFFNGFWINMIRGFHSRIAIFVAHGVLAHFINLNKAQ